MATAVLVLVQLAAAVAVTSAAIAPSSAWEHAWDTMASAQFVDFGYQPYTASQAAFLASHYFGISIEKCSSPNDTEAVVWASARQVKALNPATRVVFYWDVDQGALKCYAAYAEFMARPDLWLYDDKGLVVNGSHNQPIMDYSNADARAWWVAVPLGGTGSPQAPWIDGVLADGAGGLLSAANCYRPATARISDARCDVLLAGKSLMIRELQGLLNATNGGIVLQNGLTYYDYPNSPRDHGLSTLSDSLGVMNEHTAVFEQVSRDGTLNVSLVATVIETVLAASALGKVVVLATWPGLLVGFGKDGNPIWPSNTQPKSLTEWRSAMLSKHAFASAFYLTVADKRVFMQYELWYDGFAQGVLPCDDAPTTCCAPSSSTWYPNLLMPLGEPLGAATRTGNVWVRHFAHAQSTLNLDDPDSSTVVFF